MSSTILITGTSSGLGLAFLQHYSSLNTHPAPTPTIIALDNRPLPPAQLASFQTTKTIHFHTVDITSPQQLHDVASQLQAMPIHLMIHCAGVRGLVPEIVEQKRGDVEAAETLDVMSRETMMKAFEINTWGTFNLVKSFLPNLRLAAEEAPSALNSSPKVVILSSRMGSIAGNDAGGGYAYRASKAALNAMVKSFSVDVKEVVFSLLHPGRVETGLVEWKEEGAMSVEESLRDCLKVIDRLEMRDSGKLVDRFGVEIEW